MDCGWLRLTLKNLIEFSSEFSHKEMGKLGIFFYQLYRSLVEECFLHVEYLPWTSIEKATLGPKKALRQRSKKKKKKSRYLQWVLSEYMQTVHWGYKCTWKEAERTEGRADTESAAQFLFLKVQSFNCCSLVAHLTTAPILLESQLLQKQLFGSKQARIVEDILPCISYL